MIQWFALTGIFWLACNGYQLYKWVVRKKQANGIRKKLKRYACACFFISGIIALSLLGYDSYGVTNTWCWIDGTTNESSKLRFGLFYVFLIIAWIYNGIILSSISWTVSKRVALNNSHQSNKDSQLKSAELVIRNRLQVYLGVFVLTWIFSLINALVVGLTNKEYFITSFLQAIFVPLQGFFNAIAYGGILNEDGDIYFWLENNWSSLHT